MIARIESGGPALKMPYCASGVIADKEDDHFLVPGQKVVGLPYGLPKRLQHRFARRRYKKNGTASNEAFRETDAVQ